MITPLPRSWTLLVAASLAGLVGCAIHRTPSPVEPAEVASGPAAYALGCGDVLEVTFANNPAWDCAASIGLDGRLPLAGAGRPAVQGLTLAEAHEAIAAAGGVGIGEVGLTLAEFRAGRVYLTGPENGIRRTLPYIGPEPVLDFLDRSGALKPGSAQLQEIQVLRSNLATGGLPQVFRVDAASSDIVLQASDEVQIGETFRSRLARLLPDWALPLYRKVVGLLPPDPWPSPRG